MASDQRSEKVFKIFDSHSNFDETMSNFVVITAPADGLGELKAWRRPSPNPVYIWTNIYEYMVNQHVACPHVTLSRSVI